MAYQQNTWLTTVNENQLKRCMQRNLEMTHIMQSRFRFCVKIVINLFAIMKNKCKVYQKRSKKKYQRNWIHLLLSLLIGRTSTSCCIEQACAFRISGLKITHAHLFFYRFPVCCSWLRKLYYTFAKLFYFSKTWN